MIIFKSIHLPVSFIFSFAAEKYFIVHMYHVSIIYLSLDDIEAASCSWLLWL